MLLDPEQKLSASPNRQFAGKDILCEITWDTSTRGADGRLEKIANGLSRVAVIFTRSLSVRQPFAAMLPAVRNSTALAVPQLHRQLGGVRADADPRPPRGARRGGTCCPGALPPRPARRKALLPTSPPAPTSGPFPK